MYQNLDFKINGYSIERLDRDQGECGGLAICVRNGISYSRLPTVTGRAPSLPGGGNPTTLPARYRRSPAMDRARLPHPTALEARAVRVKLQSKTSVCLLPDRAARWTSQEEEAYRRLFRAFNSERCHCRRLQRQPYDTRCQQNRRQRSAAGGDARRALAWLPLNTGAGTHIKRDGDNEPSDVAMATANIASFSQLECLQRSAGQ